MPKQTAGNNKILANIKRQFNSKIYARALEILNSQGEDALRQYIGQYFNERSREQAVNDLMTKSISPTSETTSRPSVKSLRAKYASKAINNGNEDARKFARRVLLSKFPDERWNIDEFLKQSSMSSDDYVEDRDVIEEYAQYCE